MINEVNGNLIKLAKEGKFDVVAHGCNCHCLMKRGIAPQMAAAFGCDTYSLEGKTHKGDIRKLGNIDYRLLDRREPLKMWTKAAGVKLGEFPHIDLDLAVVNMYTQYHWSEPSRFGIPLDYIALEICLVKMNHIFKGKHIGLPRIGCGLAGGDWKRVSKIIENTLKDCTVTIVNYLL